MTLQEAVKQRINNLLDDFGINKHELSTRAGLPDSTINSILNGTCSTVTLTTLLHICEAFNMTLKDFFNDTSFKNITKKALDKLKAESK